MERLIDLVRFMLQLCFPGFENNEAQYLGLNGVNYACDRINLLTPLADGWDWLEAHRDYMGYSDPLPLLHYYAAFPLRLIPYDWSLCGRPYSGPTRYYSFHKDGSGRSETCDCVECMKDFDPGLPRVFLLNWLDDLS